MRLLVKNIKTRHIHSSDEVTGIKLFKIIASTVKKLSFLGTLSPRSTTKF